MPKGTAQLVPPSISSSSDVNLQSNHQWASKIDPKFWGVMGVLLMFSYGVTPYPEIARWTGFLFGSYAAVANDSIQTLGTFIASNKHRPWWMLWIFAAGIFVVTSAYSWLNYGGDVSYARLASKGFEQTPMSFTFLQVAAPLVLIVLTRWKMPVSTTFLLLTSFATEMKSVQSVLYKSLSGYVLAFGLAIVLWLSMSKVFDKWFQGKAHPLWSIGQWLTTGTLWSVWLMQDAANIAVYLPRQLSPVAFAAFLSTIVLGLGWIFFKGGDRIQEVVDEKTCITDIRAATIVDLLYAVILFYFKMHSKIPMSTTWVFLGLLGGRELAMAFHRNQRKESMQQALKMLGKDASLAGVGLLISFGIAILVNSQIEII